MATKKGTIEKVVTSAVDATVELGEAAKGFKESWEHVKKAQAKGRPATRAASRAGKTVVRSAKKATKSAKRMVTGKR